MIESQTDRSRMCLKLIGNLRLPSGYKCLMHSEEVDGREGRLPRLSHHWRYRSRSNILKMDVNAANHRRCCSKRLPEGSRVVPTASIRPRCRREEVLSGLESSEAACASSFADSQGRRRRRCKVLRSCVSLHPTYQAGRVLDSEFVRSNQKEAQEHPKCLVSHQDGGQRVQLRHAAVSRGDYHGVSPVTSCNLPLGIIHRRLKGCSRAYVQIFVE